MHIEIGILGAGAGNVAELSSGGYERAKDLGGSSTAGLPGRRRQRCRATWEDSLTRPEFK